MVRRLGFETVDGKNLAVVGNSIGKDRNTAPLRFISTIFQCVETRHGASLQSLIMQMHFLVEPGNEMGQIVEAMA